MEGRGSANLIRETACDLSGSACTSARCSYSWNKMSDAKGRCVAAPLLLLTLLTIFGSCVEEVDLSRFTSSLVDLANNSLGVKIMQVQCRGL